MATPIRSGVAFVSNNGNRLLRHNCPVSRLTGGTRCLRITCTLVRNSLPGTRRGTSFFRGVHGRANIRSRLHGFFRNFHHSTRPVTVVINIINTLSTFCRRGLSIDGRRRHRVATVHLVTGVPALTTVDCGCSRNRPFVCPHGSFGCTRGFLCVVFTAPTSISCGAGSIVAHTVSGVFALRTSRRRGTSASAMHLTNSANTGPCTYVTTNVTTL